MEDWMKQSVTQLKRLVKSRAGRIAELQMEIKILEGIIDRKVKEGDLGGSPPRKTQAKAEKPAEREAASQENQEESHSGDKEATPEEEKPKEENQSKIKQKSSDHAFEEID